MTPPYCSGRQNLDVLWSRKMPTYSARPRGGSTSAGISRASSTEEEQWATLSNVNTQVQTATNPRTQGALDSVASLFKEVDWLIPPYFTLPFLANLAHAIEVASPAERLKVIQVILTDAYTPDYLARAIIERYSKTTYVQEFKRDIDESIRAYFVGYKRVAIVALVPIVEGIVREVATSHGRNIGRGTAKLNEEFQKFVDREIQSLHCYGDRVVMLESLRSFVRENFLIDTDSYTGFNELNRHGILHRIFRNFGDDLNFFRLINLLDLLCFAICLEKGGAITTPPTTPESLKLARHYMVLKSMNANMTPFGL
jgi:hypothetical protein